MPENVHHFQRIDMINSLGILSSNPTNIIHIVIQNHILFKSSKIDFEKTDQNCGKNSSST